MDKSITIYDVYEFNTLNVYKVSMDLFSRNKSLFYPLIGLYIYFFLITVFERVIGSYFVPNGFLQFDYYLNPFFIFVFDFGTIIVTLFFLSCLTVMIKEILFISDQKFSTKHIIIKSLRILPKILVSYFLILSILFSFNFIFNFLISSQMFQNSLLNTNLILLITGIVFLLINFGLIIVLAFLPVPIIFNENNLIKSIKYSLRFVRDNYWSVIGVYIFGFFLILLLTSLFGFIGNSFVDLVGIDLTFSFTYSYGIVTATYIINILSIFLSLLASGIIFSLIIVGLTWGYYKESNYRI